MVGLSWTDAVDRVLDLSSAPPATQGVPYLGENRGWYDRWVDMTHWWLDRAATTPTPFQEKVVLFWHGLLCSGMDKVSDHQAMFDQLQLFRTMGTGDVVPLYTAVSLQPAMIRYLDNHQNRNGSPNENFARELMELFTIGHGNFSENDVIACSRAWTGHGLDHEWHGYQFHAHQHDFGTKTFLGIARNWDGPDTIEALWTGPTADLAARHLATKAWTFFAHPNPSAAVVSDLAAAFTAGGRRFDALVRGIFLHPQFRTDATRQGLVRSPIEFVVHALHQTGLDCDLIHPEWFLGDMGQKPYDPPNVSGWRPNGYWISSAATWAKAELANRFRWHYYSDTDALLGHESQTPAAAVQSACDLYGLVPTARTRAAMEAFVRGERERRSSWSERAGLLLLPLLTPEYGLC